MPNEIWAIGLLLVIAVVAAIATWLYGDDDDEGLGP
jgi:hypothetical protein